MERSFSAKCGKAVHLGRALNLTCLEYFLGQGPVGSCRHSAVSSVSMLLF